MIFRKKQKNKHRPLCIKKSKKTSTVPLLLLLMVGGSLWVDAFEVLPQVKMSEFFLNPKSAQTFLRFLTVNGRTIDEGKIGTRPALFRLRQLQFVSSAFIHIYMHPVNNKFYVEHFYAALGLGAEYQFASGLHAVFLPLYHESAHLADGYPFNIETNKKIISNESLQFRFEYTKQNFISLLQFDYYWHAIERQLKYNLGMGIQWESPVLYSVSFIMAGYGFIVSDKTGRSFNSRVFAGVNFKRKMKAGIFYKNQNGLGQDYLVRQTGLGLQINFNL